MTQPAAGPVAFPNPGFSDIAFEANPQDHAEGLIDKAGVRTQSALSARHLADQEQLRPLGIAAASGAVLFWAGKGLARRRWLKAAAMSALIAGLTWKVVEAFGRKSMARRSLPSSEESVPAGRDQVFWWADRICTVPIMVSKTVIATSEAKFISQLLDNGPIQFAVNAIPGKFPADIGPDCAHG